MKMKRIAVKIGSNVLTRKDGTLDITRMSAITDQVAELHKRGWEVILISSGAVASGRSEINPNHTLDEVSSRQLYSAIGQAKLMGKYYTLFREHGIICGQVLTTKEGLDKADHYQNQQHCMEVMLGERVIPIVNENDTLSITELMFTDNDELSGLMAEMMQSVLPMRLDATVVARWLITTSITAPTQPSATPPALSQVIGSRRKTAAKTIVRIGTKVEIIEASMGDVSDKPHK